MTLKTSKNIEVYGRRTLIATWRLSLVSAARYTCPIPPDAAPHGASTSGGLSNDAFRAALSRARRRFGETLRAEIEETIDDQEDVDDELRYLLRVLMT